MACTTFCLFQTEKTDGQVSDAQTTKDQHKLAIADPAFDQSLGKSHCAHQVMDFEAPSKACYNEDFKCASYRSPGRWPGSPDPGTATAYQHITSNIFAWYNNKLVLKTVFEDADF